MFIIETEPKPARKVNLWECLKMRSDTIGFITGIALVLMVYSSGFLMGESSNERATEKLAIENGCGQYNPQSGKFEWLQVNRN